MENFFSIRLDSIEPLESALYYGASSFVSVSRKPPPEVFLREDAYYRMSSKWKFMLFFVPDHLGEEWLGDVLEKRNNQLKLGEEYAILDILVVFDAIILCFSHVMTLLQSFQDYFLDIFSIFDDLN